MHIDERRQQQVQGRDAGGAADKVLRIAAAIGARQDVAVKVGRDLAPSGRVLSREEVDDSL